MCACARARVCCVPFDVLCDVGVMYFALLSFVEIE